MLAPATSRRFDEMWAQLQDVGRDEEGETWTRLALTPEDARLRSWFLEQLHRLDLDVVEDGAGNVWGWWGGRPTRERPGLATGSHLDSVPGGGAFDGPLGVVSAIAALEEVVASGAAPDRPVGVVCFSDEEGGRFGVACTGSRVLTGAMTADAAQALRDGDGVTLGEAWSLAGRDVRAMGPDPELLASLAVFVELHIEQGLHQQRTGDPLAVATHIWPHGRWRVEVRGQGNHAGTTALSDRDDPTLTLARFVLAAREAAQRHGAVATVGRVRIEPGGTNVIARSATAWLDVRAEGEEAVRAVLGDLADFAPVQESFSPATRFDPGLGGALAETVGALTPDPPLLGTGAGHDAGILQLAGVRSGMLFVRNPTGISHAAGEASDREDCVLGVAALAEVIRRWLAGTLGAESTTARGVSA